MGEPGKARRFAARLAALLAAALLATALAGCAGGGGTEAGEGTLRVGVRSDIVGFGFYNEGTGKYYGLEIDIAEELAERMGYADVELVTVTPDSRKDALLNGEVDCLVACYSVSSSREENFDFSPAYYTDASVIMVEDSSLITDVSQLAGRTIGIMSGSNAGPTLAIKLNELGVIGENVIENTDEGTQYEGVYVKKIPSYKELSDALEAGAVDAACMDASITQTYLVELCATLPTEIAEQSYGVATQKGSELSGRVAETVQGMLDDGTVAALIDKWD